VLRSEEDGNIGSIMGIGAPVWTGGLLQFVKTYGYDRFVARCRELARLRRSLRAAADRRRSCAQAAAGGRRSRGAPRHRHPITAV
jgi:hypothetical protein